MASITQEMWYRLSLIKYTEKVNEANVLISGLYLIFSEVKNSNKATAPPNTKIEL